MHPVAPHKQASVFDVAPSVCVQLGAVMHRQEEDSKEEAKSHDAVEVNSEL